MASAIQIFDQKLVDLEFEIIARETWGATPSPRPPMLPIWRGLWAIHWRDRPKVGKRPGDTLMRGAERYQEKTKGWSDLAYHVGVDRAGKIYQGRDFGRKGGATFGRNHDTMALVFLFGEDELTPEALAAAMYVLHVHCPALGFAFKEAQPHSFFRNTDCPGDQNRAEAIPFLNTAPLALHRKMTKGIDMSMTVAIDLSGVIAYVDRAYTDHGQAPGADPAGRRYWVDTAIESADPVEVLSTMVGLLVMATQAGSKVKVGQ